MRRATLLVGVLALLVGCGGSDEPPKKGGAPAAKATATPDPNTIVRWPRFWAVREGAETGAEDNLDTRYMAGYDENAVVYNGQDVVRVLAKQDGKQTGRVLLPRDRFVCATPPRREIDAGVAVFGVGTIGRDEGTCDQVIGVSTSTGKKVWSSPRFPGRGGVIDPLLDAREGVTMFSTGTTLVGFDTATGKQLWRRSAAKLGKARDRYARERCEIAAALAADRPVIVVYPSSCASGFDPTEIVGLDLKTGKEVWTAEDPRDPELFSPYYEVPHPLDGRFLGVIANGDDDEAPEQAAFVESEAGNTSRYKLPANALAGDEPLCTDFATDDGLAWSDTCMFVAGEHLLHVHKQQSVPDDEDYIEIVAAELDTGVPEWRFRWDGDGTPYGHPEMLGLNAARDELWIGRGNQEVERLSVETGKRVGRGLLRPGLQLPRFATVGPDFVLVRGVSGITDVKSGLDYYVTKAPSG